MRAAQASLTVASATFRDLVRRPGLVLATLAVASLLALLPDICRRALDDSSALALQVGITSITLFLTLAAGFAGLRAGAADGDLGATPEWLTAPLGPFAYVAGRFAGIGAVCAALLFVLALVTPQLAAVFLVAAIVASRTVVPQLDSAGGPAALLAAALPDPVRVDLSREVAFHRPVDASSAAFALLAAALQTAALLVVAAWCIRRRET